MRAGFARTYVRNERTYLRRTFKTSRDSFHFVNARARILNFGQLMIRRKRGDFAGLRAAVSIRSDGRCERCKGVLDWGWECHHRKLRSQGGRDELSNLLALHSSCHRDAHDQPKQSYRVGLLVRSHVDPRTASLLLFGTRWVLLDPSGAYTPTKEPT